MTPDQQTIKKLEEELKRVTHERDMLLEAIPPCHEHGDKCVPHALEWIWQMKSLSKSILERLVV